MVTVETLFLSFGLFIAISLQVSLEPTAQISAWPDTSLATLSLAAVPLAFELRRIPGRFINNLDFVSAYLSCMDVVQYLSLQPPLYHLEEFNNVDLPTRGTAKTFIGVHNLMTGSNLLVKNIIWALAKVALLNPLQPEDLRTMGFFLMWRDVDFAEMMINVQQPLLVLKTSNITTGLIDPQLDTFPNRSAHLRKSVPGPSEAKSSLAHRQILPLAEGIRFSIAYGRGLLQGHNVLAGLLLGLTQIAGRLDLDAREGGFEFNIFGYRFEFANERHIGGHAVSFYHTNRKAIQLVRDLSVQLTRRSEGYKEFTALMMSGGQQRGTLRVNRY